MIDPLGFGFEHFDAVGRWRDTDAGAAIDATGAVPKTNVPFDGGLSLAGAIEADPRFLDCVTRKLMTYALGRSLVADDDNGIADIRARLGSSDGQLSQLIELVASSPAMTMRQGEEPATP
jgi:hypothetical protein